VSESLEAFQALVSGIDYPMFIVTAAADGERSGCFVGFATQASIDPARFLVMISKANHTCKVAEDAGTLVVHFLHAGNRPLANLFGEETGDEIDKFAACRWKSSPDGTPILLGVRGWLTGAIVARLDAGDHIAHVVEVTDAAVDESGPQLGLQAAKDMEPGHPA
jgi:flavin reductase (DIM6/NTAB) family NADH-FMN oxidoreductase RutF